MTDTPNQLDPRSLAVALIARAIDDVREEILQHQREARDPGALFHSRIRVFLEQVAVELKRAAIFLEFHDQAEDDPE